MKPSEACGKIEEWISARVREAGADGAVVGLSGGVDSGVVAVLAKRALKENLLGLILPCDSQAKDAEKAEALADKFGIRTRKIDLTLAFKDLRKILPQTNDKVLGNLKSRLRMAALYHFANASNYLVLGTSNKSEIAIGYFTKHGDGAADIEPIGDLYKTQVFEIAKHLDIPDEIIRARPSAGLWYGQTDEAEIGMTYLELDTILKAAEAANEYEFKFKNRALVERVRRMVKASVHKRKMPDVCKL